MKDQPNTTQRDWKNSYRAINVNGFEWGGWLDDEGLHFFVKGNYRDGFTELKCRDSECFDGSLQMMAEMGVTR